MPTRLLELPCAHVCCITTLFFSPMQTSVPVRRAGRSAAGPVAARKLVNISGDQCRQVPTLCICVAVVALPDLPSPSTFLSTQLVQNTPQFRAAEGETPLVLLPGRPPARLSLDAPLSATGAVKDGQKQVRFTAAY